MMRRTNTCEHHRSILAQINDHKDELVRHTSYLTQSTRCGMSDAGVLPRDPGPGVLNFVGYFCTVFWLAIVLFLIPYLAQTLGSVTGATGTVADTICQWLYAYFLVNGLTTTSALMEDGQLLPQYLMGLKVVDKMGEPATEFMMYKRLIYRCLLLIIPTLCTSDVLWLCIILASEPLIIVGGHSYLHWDRRICSIPDLLSSTYVVHWTVRSARWC
jgi:hypothetical protein